MRNLGERTRMHRLGVEDEAAFQDLLRAAYGGTYSHQFLYEKDGLAALIRDGKGAFWGEFCPSGDGSLLAHTGILFKDPRGFSQSSSATPRATRSRIGSAARPFLPRNSTKRVGNKRLPRHAAPSVSSCRDRSDPEPQPLRVPPGDGRRRPSAPAGPRSRCLRALSRRDGPLHPWKRVPPRTCRRAGCPFLDRPPPGRLRRLADAPVRAGACHHRPVSAVDGARTSSCIPARRFLTGQRGSFAQWAARKAIWGRSLPPVGSTENG